MKKLLIVTLISTSFLFANNIYKNENTNNIDMHGKINSSKLIDSSNSLSTKDVNKIGITKPTSPTKPKELINEKQNLKLKKDKQ